VICEQTGFTLSAEFLDERQYKAFIQTHTVTY
jgi:hypothetical protein